MVNLAPSLEILFVICDGLNEQVIITADAVEKLKLIKHYDVIHLPDSVTVESMVSKHSEKCTDVGNATEGSDDDEVLPLDGFSILPNGDLKTDSDLLIRV